MILFYTSQHNYIEEGESIRLVICQIIVYFSWSYYVCSENWKQSQPTAVIYGKIRIKKKSHTHTHTHIIEPTDQGTTGNFIIFATCTEFVNFMMEPIWLYRFFYLNNVFVFDRQSICNILWFEPSSLSQRQT